MLYICIYKLCCDEPVSTVHVEQHQSTEIVIIGKIAVSPLSLLKIVLAQTLERQSTGNTAHPAASQLLAKGLQSSWESRATAGLETLGLQYSCLQSRGKRNSPAQNLA